MKVVWELKVFEPEGAKFAHELQGPLRLVDVVYTTAGCSKEVGFLASQTACSC